MRDYLSSEVRNIALLGHSGAGKSSIIESILYFNKVIDRMGTSLGGNSAMDFDQEEIKRGQSVYLSLAPVEWKDKKINFIDTPGYFDYYGETASALRVADNALIVVSAKDGIETGTERAYEMITERQLPTIFFINKMDEENADFNKVYEELRAKFGKSIFAFETPIIRDGEVVGSVNVLRKKAWYYDNHKEAQPVPEDMVDLVDSYYDQICETVALTDEELMESYFEDMTLTEEEIAKGL